MKSFLQYKYNVELMKIGGVALWTPLCANVFNLLVVVESLSPEPFVRMLISLPFAYIGVLVFNRGREISEEIDARINSGIHNSVEK